MIGTILLHRDGPLKRTIANSDRDTGSGGFLDDFAGLVVTVACHHFTIDLQGEGGGEGRRG